MDVELKPCPFCGSEAWIDERGCFIVYCLGCGTGSNAFDTEAQAIAAWNRRAAVDAAEARIVAWTEAEAAEFLKSPKDSLEFLHGESLLELVRCYRDGEHRRQS